MLKKRHQTKGKCAKRSRFSPMHMLMGPIKRNAKVQAVLAGAITWSLAWKGVALWRAAKNDSKPWFVTLLVVNTLGVLDAFYIFVIDRRSHLREREINAIYAEADASDDL